jgi:hypothetical protein
MRKPNGKLRKSGLYVYFSILIAVTVIIGSVVLASKNGRVEQRNNATMDELFGKNVIVQGSNDRFCNGVLISAYGRVLTCAHVFLENQPSTCTVILENRDRPEYYEYKVISQNRSLDLAEMIPTTATLNTPYCKLQKGPPFMSQAVYVVGYARLKIFKLPESLEHLNSGWRLMCDRETIAHVSERNWAVIRDYFPDGMSGSAVFSENAELLGILRGGTSPEYIGPENYYFFYALNSIRKNGVLHLTHSMPATAH